MIKSDFVLYCLLGITAIMLILLGTYSVYLSNGGMDTESLQSLNLPVIVIIIIFISVFAWIVWFAVRTMIKSIGKK